MKKIFSTSLLLSLLVSGFAQTPVSLRLNHKLGTEDFELDKVGKNNLGHEFKATRLEYYVAEITIVHDGTETAVPLDVVALVRPEDEVSTLIPLGDYDVDAIEGVKFHIGVYEPVNHGDPALWPEEHPLAPKSPSMHWGWTAGYRFVAFEGVGGVDFSQGFQMHGLGEANYFQVIEDVDVVEVDGVLEMNLIGNYEEGLNDIDLTAGIISHGETGAALTVLKNWRDDVFGNYYLSTEEEQSLTFGVYPNPSSGQVTIDCNHKNVQRVGICNLLGEEVVNSVVNGPTVALNLTVAGVYMVILYDQDGTALGSQRLVIE